MRSYFLNGVWLFIEYAVTADAENCRGDNIDLLSNIIGGVTTFGEQLA